MSATCHTTDVPINQQVSHDLHRLFHLLLDAYGPRSWWPADNPFEVCVGANLTLNTNWGNVERAIANLQREGVATPEALDRIPEERLANLIRPSGYFNIKSRRHPRQITGNEAGPDEPRTGISSTGTARYRKNRFYSASATFPSRNTTFTSR